ncbi:MAG: hypothetical protein ABS893_07030 [Aerococcus urinaeequi]
MMFKHVLLYNIKIVLRNNEGLLWGLIFPLVYGLVYMLAFQGINNQTENFDAIPVAVVYEGTADQITEAKDLLANIATEGSIEAGDVVESEEIATGVVDSSDYPLLAINMEDEETAQAHLREAYFPLLLRKQFGL